MSEQERDRELRPSGGYGGCSSEGGGRLGDGGDQPGGGSIAEKQAALQRKIELNEAYELERCGGLFGSKYLSQVPGVDAGCDDDPNEVYLTYMKREGRSRRGLYMEEDKGDGEYVYELSAGQYDQNAWLDRHLATQARLRREGVLFDMQRALGRDAVMQREALRRRKEEEEREAEAERAEERKRTKQARKEAKEAAKRAKTWEHDDFAEGRKSMHILLLCLKKSEGVNARALYEVCVLKRWIFEHVSDNCFEYEKSLVHRLEDFTLANKYMVCGRIPPTCTST